MARPRRVWPDRTPDRVWLSLHRRKLPPRDMLQVIWRQHDGGDPEQLPPLQQLATVALIPFGVAPCYLRPSDRKLTSHGRLRARWPDPHDPAKLEALALEEQQLRSSVARLWRLGYSVHKIAGMLSISPMRTEKLQEQALAMVVDGPMDRSRTGPELGALTGEVISAPDEIEFYRTAYELRKRALPYTEIAARLGRTPHEVRIAVRTTLRALEEDEYTEVNESRRMLLEQLDAMLAAVYAPATGRLEDGTYTPVTLEAMDRMLKILAAKSKLLGTDAPRKIDLYGRIDVMAAEYGYDPDELKEIADEVLRSYALKGRPSSL